MTNIETYYLIDYENVGSEGLSGCSTLKKTDHIVIFFTKNAKRIDMSEIADHGEAELIMEEVPAGKQSADLHICAYLGYLSGMNEKKDKNAVIVSKDTDYDNVVRFLMNKTGIQVTRTQKIKMPEAKPVKTRQPLTKGGLLSRTAISKKTKLNQEVMQAARAAGYDASVANTVAQITSGHYGKEELLTEVHNDLRDIYTDYLDVYASIKSVLSKYADGKQEKKELQKSSAKERVKINTEVMRALSKAGYSHEIIGYTASLVAKNLSEKNGKQKTYRTIISKFGQEKGLGIYNQIKSLF